MNDECRIMKREHGRIAEGGAKHEPRKTSVAEQSHLSASPTPQERQALR